MTKPHWKLLCHSLWEGDGILAGCHRFVQYTGARRNHFVNFARRTTQCSSGLIQWYIFRFLNVHKSNFTGNFLSSYSQQENCSLNQRGRLHITSDSFKLLHTVGCQLARTFFVLFRKQKFFKLFLTTTPWRPKQGCILCFQRVVYCASHVAQEPLTFNLWHKVHF